MRSATMRDSLYVTSFRAGPELHAKITYGGRGAAALQNRGYYLCGPNSPQHQLLGSSALDNPRALWLPRGGLCSEQALLPPIPSHPQPASWTRITFHVCPSLGKMPLQETGSRWNPDPKLQPTPNRPRCSVASPALTCHKCRSSDHCQKPTATPTPPTAESPGEGSHPPSLFTHLSPSKE